MKGVKNRLDMKNSFYGILGMVYNYIVETLETAHYSYIIDIVSLGGLASNASNNRY